MYDEPEPMPFAARHWLGAALIEAKRFEEAERVYRAELDDHPRNGWSLLGLKQALVGRGLPTTDVDADLQVELRIGQDVTHAGAMRQAEEQAARLAEQAAEVLAAAPTVGV